LAKVHSLPNDNLVTNNYFDKLRNLCEEDFHPITNCLPSKEYLWNEINILEDFIRKTVKSTPLVLSHGDLHIFNLLYRTNGTIQFLDWELTHLNHRAFDIAFFFQVLATTEIASKMQFRLPENAEKVFIKYYQESNLEEDANPLYEEVQIYKLVVLLFLIITQSIYADLSAIITSDPENYHKMLYAEYLTKKNLIIK